MTVFIIAFLNSGCISSRGNQQFSFQTETVFDPPPNEYYHYMKAMFALDNNHMDEAARHMEQALQIDPNSVYLMKELLVLYLRQKDNESAYKLAERLLEEGSDDLKILTLYGRISQSLNHSEKAIRAYKQILEKDPQQKNIYILLAQLYLKNRQPYDAQEVLKQLLIHFPESYAAHYYLGKAYIETDNPEAAEREFKKTLEIEPKLEEPRFALVELYKDKGLNEKIETLYEELLSENQNNYRAAMELAFFCFQQNKNKKSSRILKELGRKSEDDPQVLHTLVRLYLEKEKYEEAVVIIDHMLAGAPESSELHYLAGIANDGLKDSDRAMKHLKKVRPPSPFYSNAVLHIAYLYQEDNQFEKAVDFLESVLKTTSNDPELIHYLGLLYEDEKKYEKAVNILKKGIDIYPDNPKLHFRLGVVYDKLNNKEGSIEKMKKVIAMEPENANALNYLGYTYADLDRNLEKAEELIKKALTYKPDDGYIIDSLGWVYFKQGRYEEAVKVLEKAVSKVPDDPIILEHMGDAYMKIGKLQKALEYFRKSFDNKEPDQDKTILEKKIHELSSPHIRQKN